MEESHGHLLQQESEEREREKKKLLTSCHISLAAHRSGETPPAPCGLTVLGPYPGKAIVGARRQEGAVALEEAEGDRTVSHNLACFTLSGHVTLDVTFMCEKSVSNTLVG